MLIQGPIGWRLDITHKYKYSRSFFLYSSVDGGIQWQNEQYFYSVSEICSFRDPLVLISFNILKHQYVSIVLFGTRFRHVDAATGGKYGCHGERI